MSDYLVIGANGALGHAWCQLLDEEGLSWRGATRSDIDLRQQAAIADAIQPGVTCVINCAAWTDVDGAEAAEAEATAVNGTAVGWLAARCAEVDAKLVHYSTDYVFDGCATTPYKVDAERRPINAYGRSKVRGEELLERSKANHLLVRTSWLYATRGKNFVRSIAQAAMSGRLLRVVDDQRGTPSSVGHLASSTLTLLRQSRSGTFHITDGGECSWFEFAQAIVALVAPSREVDACSSADYPRPAPRPRYSVLDVSKTEQAIGPNPGWQRLLEKTLTEFGNDLVGES